MQARNAVLSLAIEVDGAMLTLAQDSPNELGEDAARTDLHERSHPPRVHRFDLVDEADRLG